ncbi:hypothetical protein DFH28DRAFT_1077397 [Melampsora americana]|nr:hypothetical protein DFH28DRAFT_1077397 [Melampsora americana]
MVMLFLLELIKWINSLADQYRSIKYKLPLDLPKKNQARYMHLTCFIIIISNYKCDKLDQSKPQIEPTDCQSALMGFDRFFTGLIHFHHQHQNSKSCGACQIKIRSSDGQPINGSSDSAFKELNRFMKACPYLPGEFSVQSIGIKPFLIIEVHSATALQC